MKSVWAVASIITVAVLSSCPASEISVTVAPRDGEVISDELILSVFRTDGGRRVSVQKFSFSETETVNLNISSGEPVGIYIRDSDQLMVPRYYGPFSSATEQEQSFVSVLESIESREIIAAKKPKVRDSLTVMKSTLVNLPPDSEEAQELTDWIKNFSNAPAPKKKAAKQSPLRILIPAYFFPSLDGSDPAKGHLQWREVINQATPDCEVMAVISPANGPIARQDPAGEPWRLKCYTSLLVDARANRNVQFLMYIALAKGKTSPSGDWKVRSANELESDVEAWIQNYPLGVHQNIVGFFIDEHPSTDPTEMKAARSFRETIHSKYPKAKVFLNLGRTSDDFRFLPESKNEVAVFHEQSAATNSLEQPIQPNWVRDEFQTSGFDRSRFAALIHGSRTLSSTMIRKFTEGSDPKLTYGWIYVTDESDDGKRWNRLSTHWKSLTDEVRTLNRKKQ